MWLLVEAGNEGEFWRRSRRRWRRGASDTNPPAPGQRLTEQKLSRAKVGIGLLLHRLQRPRGSEVRNMKAAAFNAFKKAAEAVLPAPTQSHFKDKKVRSLAELGALRDRFCRGPDLRAILPLADPHPRRIRGGGRLLGAHLPHLVLVSNLTSPMPHPSPSLTSPPRPQGGWRRQQALVLPPPRQAVPHHPQWYAAQPASLAVLVTHDFLTLSPFGSAMPAPRPRRGDLFPDPKP